MFVGCVCLGFKDDLFGETVELSTFSLIIRQHRDSVCVNELLSVTSQETSSGRRRVSVLL